MGVAWCLILPQSDNHTHSVTSLYQKALAGAFTKLCANEQQRLDEL
jgi:molybdopterin-guanine dinucleotide biosynthesis protein A